MASASGNHVEQSLQSIWAHVLNQSHVPLDQPFLSVGGDSISAMQVVGQCRKEGMSLGVQEVLRSRSIAQLATAVTEVESGSYDHQEYFDEEFDLSPIQSLYFQRPNTHGHFNQSFYLRVTVQTAADDFQAAVEQLVTRHSMLRARFSFSLEQGWQQRLTNDIVGSYRFRHRAVSSQAEIDMLIEDSQQCFDHTKGPLFAADFFDFGTQQFAFLTAHHLVVDLVTWRLLLEELEEILKGGQLLAPALPFQKWAELQSGHAETLELTEILPSVDVPPMDFSYWGIEHQDNTYGNASHASFELDKDLSSAFLTSCHGAYKTEPVEVLLASLLQSWSLVFTDRPIPAIFNEGHGREPWNTDIDITRTVGWFTALSPILVKPSENPTDTVRKIKDFKRRIPGNGRPYFARRCLTEDGRKHFETHWPMEILFNYLGQYQQLERASALLQPLGTMAGETGKSGGTSDFGHQTCRWGLFEISAFVFKGHLKVAFTFNGQMKHQMLVQKWIAECQATLSKMICGLGVLEPKPTLSDFPLLSLTEERFYAMLDRLSAMGIRDTDVEDVYPCSSMQEGLLLSQTKDAGFYAAATLHEIQIPTRQLYWETAANAWRQVVRRHPALRTVFLENVGTKGLYNQVVLKTIDANIVHLEAQNETEAISLIEDQRTRSYNNGLCPNHRFTICNTADRRVFCSLDISHAIMDGQSMSLLVTELKEACEGQLQLDGTSYSEYIAWLLKQPQEASLEFWKSYLDGSEVCSFPVLHDGLGHTVKRELVTIRMDLISIGLPDLQSFCNTHGITLSNVFHTAWALTLSCYTGSNDVNFGYLTSARDSEEIKAVGSIVGPLINTLVCRVDLSNDSRCLLDVLQDVQRDYMEAIPHRHIALADVQHVLELSGANLFNTALSYRRLPQEQVHDDQSLHLVEIRPIYDPTEYPVSINIEVGDEAAAVDLDYWTDHLTAIQATNVASTFVHALENIVLNAKRRISALDHISTPHLHQIQDWNVMPATMHECVHDRFAYWAVSKPDAAAICGHDGEYTYAELDAVTDRLAHHLVKLGVGPEMFVPTCFDKSVFAIVAMLSVLKAGGAAVPLDATHPKPALQTRLEDASARVVLTSAARAEKLEDLASNVVLVDSAFLESLPVVAGPACVSVRPHDPVFVIFTSGSTGRPKGVVLDHSAIVTSAEAHGSKIGLGQDSRMLQFASYTFDNSLEEMFTTLQRGGCVCVPSETDRVNDLPGAIARLEANMMDLTPTVAALLTPSEVPTIKRLCLGAEPLTKALIELWSPHVSVVGQYGPSEASINSAFKDFSDGRGEATNIGKAVGCVTWIVDPENCNRLMPIGCKGELLLEGPILSRGYLNDPEKTQAAFIMDPAWARTAGSSGRRFYCTGDLVQYTSDGEMMYLGRKDSQVKLHGQRIELGEIEHHLKLNLAAGTKSAVELVKFNDSNGTKALVAFLCLHVSEGDGPAVVGAMSEPTRVVAKQVEVALANALPAYYVPSLFMPVTSMPMTTSGKLDRKVLRALAAAVPEAQLTAFRLAGKSGRAPAGHAEVTLARLWASVLKLCGDAVGAEDSFFRLGGDSIGAMRLVTAARKDGVVLNVADVFSSPKLVDMAATTTVLSADALTTPEPDMVPFELLPENTRERIVALAASECDVAPDAVQDVYPCSKLQEGLIMLTNKDPGTYVVQPIYRLPSDIDLARFQQAWRAVAATEAILRTRILYSEEHGFVQVVLREELEWRSVRDLEDIDEATRRLPAKNGARLTTFTVVGEETTSPFFVWTAHHAVYDGWSWTALFRKVEALYRNPMHDVSATVPYSRFIKYLTALDQKESGEFWLSQLANSTYTRFPQLPSPDHRVEANGQLLHHVQLVRNVNLDVTVPSMIRAAWGLLLATYSGCDDVLWGETNSGREASVPGVESIIGPTITTAPVRLRLNRDLTVHEYLKETQRQSSTSLPYQFAGLQHIRQLSSETAVACDFQSFLGIEAGDDFDVDSALWKMESANTIGTDFFSYAFIFNCKVAASSLHVEALYDNRVVDPWLVQRIVQQFDFVLGQFNNPELINSRLCDLDLLNSADRDLISAWNRKPVDIIQRCIHDVIADDQSSVRPTAPAVDAWDTGVMNYQELEERATALAHRLLSLGVKPNQFVPLCFDKSGWTVVAILAVLKTGAAFVPLDFEAPILRLRELVGDVHADLVLCAPQYENLFESIPCSTLVVERATTERGQPHIHPLPQVHSDSPAYVFYTSGSTGKPKGAVVNHYQWVTSSTAFAPGWNISESSRVLQFASYTFDACLIEIFSTLMCGGTVCVPDQAARTNDLVGVIGKFNVNWATLTPSVVRMMQPSQVSQLKTLVLVGEAMSQQDLVTWADKLTLGNGYGPTECAAIATLNTMTPHTKPNNLGKAVTARGWIVSRENHHALAPVGAVGELLLEGGAVGAGYLNDPEKSALTFVGDAPWADGIIRKAHSVALRMYKTGDLVKYNEDGTMLYLGRKDSQTKVRGQRLELSEVEHHLMEDHMVQSALASVPVTGPCAKRLVGILSLQKISASAANEMQVLSQETASLDIASIRERFCERLPAYMIPSLWVAIAQFPLMPSGKMDRKRAVQWLEHMDQDTYRVVSTMGSEPSTINNASAVESKLQSIFANVLNLPANDIRLNQSFLHLGGDSIAAMQVSSRCRAQGLPISVQDIIRARSITVLASTVDMSQHTQTTTDALEYNKPFGVSPIQKVFFETVGDCHNHFNQAEIFRLARNFEVGEVRAALIALVEIHPMLRGRFAKTDAGIWQQRVEKDPANSFRLQHHRVLTADGQTLRSIIDHSQATLDVTSGPTFSIDLFDVDDTFSQIIALVAHHLIIDVVSWGILLEDLQGLLNGIKPLPQSLPYHSWLQLQSTQTHLETAKSVFPLVDIAPANFDYWGMEGRPNISGDTIDETFHLTTRDTILLLGAQDALATEILDILVAALLESFRKVFPDRSAITIHNEGHGREPFTTRQDLSRTIGWFSTLTPIHLPVALEEKSEVINTIRWVRDFRGRTPNKGRPYFAHRNLSEAGRTSFASHWPAEAVFNYLGRLQNLDRKDALFTALEGVDSREVGENVPRLSLFDITAAVSQGAIKLSFGWNRHMQRQTEIRKWVAQCRQTLVDVVEELLQVRPEPNLSNFQHLPLLYNATSRISAALPAGVTITDIEDIYPASPMQQGLLLAQSRDPTLYTYHTIFEVRQTDRNLVDPRRLAEAWQVVVHRHQALRSVFVDSLAKNGSKDQIVMKEKAGRVKMLIGYDDGQESQMLREQPSIDCGEAIPPHRISICKTKSGKVWIKLELSHVINDGTSVSNILTDLARAYAGNLTRADKGPLYSDYIAHILSSSRDADLAYWKTYLSTTEPCFFPTLNDGRSSPREPGSIEIEVGSTQDVHVFCKKNGVTLSNVLQLAWALTLHCYVGAFDVSFGLVASGRDIPVKNIDEAVGCFVNMLITRLTFSDETTIAQLLEALQTGSIEALSHQSCSLADIQHELQLPALFNTAFTFQRRSLSRDPEETALLYENMEAADAGEYAVTVNADVTDDSISVDFGFWKDKVLPTQAQNMADTFQKILHVIVVSSASELTVGNLDFFAPSSLRQIFDWNTGLPSPIRRCVHELVHDQALARPRTTKAVEGWDGIFTYQEFDRITDRLAAHLQTIGVATETFVPILFEKSSWAIVSMIAIMKAGGAYVPLDPKHPLTRLRELIEDVGAQVVMCSRSYNTKASEVARTPMIVDNRSIKKLAVPMGTKPEFTATPDNAAYCLFTSGTTGKPKGTIIPHQAFCTSAAAFTRRMNINATSRTFQFASYTFDASCIEILSALTVGATVCVPTEDDRMNNPAGAIRKLKVNWSLLTPSVLGTIEPDRVPGLKTLVSGGEALPGPILKKWGNSTCFINAYGPTECAVVAATAYKSTLDHQLIESEPGTIGTGSGCRLWIVHPRNHDKLMPVGSVGELVVEGPTVARGYLNDEIKTAKAFISDPAWGAIIAPESDGFHTARMYKTGDLVRYNTDGSVSYIGRKDTQIKLNGQRIELGEIEFHVGTNFPDNVQSAVELVAPSSHSSAKALAVFFAVVKDQPAKDGDTVQVASTHVPAADELLLPLSDELCDMCKSAENGLAGALPAYMIPSIFIPVTKMPWTSAGKLDRNRLRTVVQNLGRETMSTYRLTSMANKKQPTTDAEKKIHRAVCSVLNLPASSVGIDDSFVRLGGDSISSMRLVASAQAEQLALSFIDIFKHPKLADLAKIGTRDDKPSQSEKAMHPFELLRHPLTTSEVLSEVAQQCRVAKDNVQDAYPTSPLQDALLTLSIKQPGAYVAQHVLALPSTIDITKFKAAWEEAIQEIDILRTRIFQLTESGSFMQAVLVKDQVRWQEAASLEEAEGEALRIPCHLGGQLVSYTLVASPGNERYFVWTLHHSLYDGWSIYLMLQRVQQIYQTGVSAIPQTPYCKFVKYLANTDTAASAAYWKASLAGTNSHQFPQLPHSAVNDASNGQTVQHTMKHAPHKHTDITPSNVIRAGWALLLAAYTGCGDVVFGETLAGRDIAVTGITEVCGPTLTTVPTRVKVDSSATVPELLSTISKTVTDRIPYQHLGLSAIKAIGEDMAAACSFQTLVVVQLENEELVDSMWSVHDNGEQSNFFTYPLVIECKMGPSNTEVLAHFDANIISSWHVQRLLYQFESVLIQLDSAIYVRNVTVFSDQDKQLVRKWNAYEPQLVNDTIPSLFLKQVALQPNAIAVSAFDGEFTYADLGMLASQLAQELVKLGAGPEHLVPICIDKSRWAIVAVMAVLFSGAAYVPLSPSDPASRHLQIVEACKASIILCSPPYGPRFVELANHVFSVSETAIRRLPAGPASVPLRAKSNDTCYVIFTSGSTGVPKGVVVEHRSIASSAAAICEGLHITPTSRVLQFCSFLFDVSVGETLAVLICGATICIPLDERRTTDLASTITALRANWAFLTPSVASTLEGPHVVPTLDTLVVGGEPMTSEVVDKWATGVRLQNGYGPTEGTVFAITNDQVSVQRDPSNIGRMLKSGRAWLTHPEDPHKLAPVGATAELCLEGPLLARGYLHDPELTAEAFITGPAFLKEISDVGESRIYRTGDLVVYAADGSIRYIGRKDNQIKLAGQRIELEEIEHHLQADESIRGAVVQLPESGPCVEKLVAVLSFHDSSGNDDQEWHTMLSDSQSTSRIDRARHRLSDLVPSYMVPAIWIAVPRIPSLASTKSDKKQARLWLENMSDVLYQRILATEPDEATEGNTNEAVATLRRIWANVLHYSIDEVKPSKSWLSLGGDSITAMKLLAKCRSEGISLTLNQVLRAKSLAQLAETLSSTVAPNHDKERINQPFELSPIQRFYFQTGGVESDTHFNQSSTIRISQHVEAAVVKRALDSIVGCHSMLRARFSKSKTGQWQQLIESRVANAYHFGIHDVLIGSDAVPIISSTQKSLDIQNGPVFAVNLFNINGKQIMFMAAHHLVVDVVSWGIILDDLEDHLASATAIALSKGLPFQTWCEMQATHALEPPQQEAVRKQPIIIQPAQLAFWGMDDRPNVYGDVEKDEFTLNESISATAMDNHEVLRTDMVDILLASIVHSFSRVFINRKVPTVFNESHGRESWKSSNIDLSRTVGWFTALFPVTIPIGKEEDGVLDTVRLVKDLRRQISDNGRPYFAHRFLTEDGRQRFADHEPMEILFNYLGRQEQSGSNDSLLQPTQVEGDEQDETSDVGTNTARMALFEISAFISDGHIHLSLMYNRRSKNQKGIRRWIAECERTLEEIATELSKIEEPQATLADFPLLPLGSYNRLERVLKTLPDVGILSFEQVEDMYPCSPIQDGMILSQIKTPESYWSSTTFEVRSKRGPVDAQKIVEAWKQVVARHPALRTVFIDSVCKGGVFDQIVVKKPDAGVVCYTCDDAELPTLLESIKHNDLNGKKRPVLPHQAAVVQTISGKVVVKVIVNHTVIDGGSLGIIGHDLQEAYEGRLSDGGPLYSDYIKYLRGLPAGDSVNYWKAKLRGVNPCYFPTTPRDPSKSRQLRSLDMRFSQFSDLHALAERSNATFANILLTAWALVLRSYTKSSDVCYGYLTSGRNVPMDNIENAVGAFINMLVSRIELTPSFSLLEIMQKVQSDFIDSMPHQHCSLAQFQHDLGLSGKSLFNTAVSIQNRVTTDDSTPAESGIEFEQLAGHDPSEFAITVNIDATRNDEAVRFTYWSDAVTDGEAKNVSSLMAKILAQALSNAKQTITELDTAIKGKPSQATMAHLALPKPRPSILRSRSSMSSSSTSPSRTPRITFPNLASPPLPTENTDLSSLIRSIVSEMVPQIVDQIVAHKSLPTESTSVTIDQMTNQMTGMLNRRASHSRGRSHLDTASIRPASTRASSMRSRRMSVASDAESRIQTAADMVATIGVMATEASNKVAPDFVEKKLLNLWSELLEMVEETIEHDDSFFQLGGDSIIAMRLVGAAREEGLSMTVADVFKNPTFADMARVVRVAGEVIDEVMSRAGESVAEKNSGGPSRLQERAPSIWSDFHSIMSEYDADAKSMAASQPPAELEPAKNETMFKRWQGFASNQSRPQALRKTSQVSQVPQTIQEGVEVTTNKSISLLGDPNVDSVISKVQVFKGGISDVFPVTDFQALAITGTLLESKWMLNYFYLEGDGPIDLRKLKQSAFRMVQAFDILRTVFVPYGDRFLQVVLRKLQPEFIYQQTDHDLETFSKDLRQRDREHGPRLGEAFIQFVVAKQKQTGRYRIFMRLSHAQYDGVCMSKILGALQDGYNGLPVSSAPSFGNFVRESAKTITGAHDHWREVLRGSKMTEIVNRFGPNYQRSAGRTITLEKRVTAPKPKGINITSATLVKAAWASTLARIASKADIVFGHVISGRNSGVANVESIVGPCLNMVPVRIVYRPEWTVLDLLNYVQDQQIANMPYESLGFREITRHCTDWPDWTNFSSVLQHDQNIQDDNPTMQLGGIEFNVGAFGSQEDFADFSIHSTSRGGSQMDVTLTYAPNSTITTDFAQHVFEMICANVVAFSEDPHTLLPSPSELSSTSSTTINSEKMRKKSSEKQPVALPADTGLSRHEVNTLATTLRSAWEQILHDEHGSPTLIDLDSDFFQLGGDIMGLAQVASILDQDEGFKVRVEDLIDKAVFVEQVGILAAERKKQIEKERQSPWGDKEKTKSEVKTKEKKGSKIGTLVNKIGFRRKESVKA